MSDRTAAQTDAEVLEQAFENDKSVRRIYPTNGTEEDLAAWASTALFFSVTDTTVRALEILGWKIVRADGDPDSKWDFDANNEHGWKCPQWCQDISWITLDTVIHTQERDEPVLQLTDESSTPPTKH